MRFDLDASIEILERTPAVLAAWLPGLSDGWLRGTEGPDTWSPFDVVGHLIDGEESDWMVRARIILDHGPSMPFTPFDRFRHLRERGSEDLESRLARFTALRIQNLADLRALELTDDDLARTGTHPEFGEVTLAQLIATWATHDLSHLAQIARVMARQYADAVGPWADYLSVLRR